jgi:hypothetical protein
VSRISSRFRFITALLAVAALGIGVLAGVAAADQGAQLTFKRWTVLVDEEERGASLGQTVERCSDQKVTSMSVSGTIKHARENVGNNERWYRDGKLDKAFHLYWNESGSGSYTTYGLGSDKGFKDGTWKVVKSEGGRVLDTATFTLKTKASC